MALILVISLAVLLASGPVTSQTTYLLNTTKSTQYIDSNGYPDMYPNNFVEEWHLTSTPGAFVVVIFVDISLENQNPCTNGDFVTISSKTYGWARYNCDAVTTTYNSYVSPDEMIVNLTTNGVAPQNPGFRMLYLETPALNFFWTIVPTRVCQKNAAVFLAQYKDTQYITLPTWPSTVYSNHMECNWQIAAPSDDYYVLLRRFYLKLGDGDTVKVWNGDFSNFICQDAKWEGDMRSEVFEFVSNTNSLNFEFLSDSAGSDVGFYIGYEAVLKSEYLASPSTCVNSAIIYIAIGCALGALVLIALIVLLVVLYKKGKICKPKPKKKRAKKAKRNVERESSFVRPETPPTPPRAPPRFARANQPMPNAPPPMSTMRQNTFRGSAF